MTTAQIVAAGAVLIALLWFALKLTISFDSEGGSIGMVPVLDGALFPPLLAWTAVGLLDGSTGWPGWPWWSYPAGWIVTTALAWWAIASAGKWKRRT